MYSVLDLQSVSPVILVNSFFPVGTSQYPLYPRPNYHHFALDNIIYLFYYKNVERQTMGIHTDTRLEQMGDRFGISHDGVYYFDLS